MCTPFVFKGFFLIGHLFLWRSNPWYRVSYHPDRLSTVRSPKNGSKLISLKFINSVQCQISTTKWTTFSLFPWRYHWQPYKLSAKSLSSDGRFHLSQRVKSGGSANLSMCKTFKLKYICILFGCVIQTSYYTWSSSDLPEEEDHCSGTIIAMQYSLTVFIFDTTMFESSQFHVSAFSQ